MDAFEQNMCLCRKPGQFRLWAISSYGDYIDIGTFVTLEFAEEEGKKILQKNYPRMVTSFGRGNFVFEVKIFDSKDMVKMLDFENIKQKK